MRVQQYVEIVRLRPDNIAAAGVAMVEEMRTLAKRRKPLTVEKLINLAKETEKKWASFCSQVPGAKPDGIKNLILKVFSVLEDTEYASDVQPSTEKKSEGDG